jgi:hypothetical protein
MAFLQGAMAANVAGFNPSAMLLSPALSPLAANPYTASLTSSPYGLYGGNAGYPNYYTEDAYRGFLSGNAAVISSEGTYRKQYWESKLLREQVRQARLDTRRRVFDEYLYERSHAPTTEDLREQARAEAVRRSLNEPPPTEVLSARALNDLLTDVQKLPSAANEVPDVPLDQEVVQRINVVPSQGRGNPGLLRDGRRLQWPQALRTLPPQETIAELREQIDTLLPKATGQAVNGRVEPAILNELNRDVTELERMLVDRVNEMPTARYIEARRFLTDLEDALRILRHPDAGDYLNGKYAAKGRTVQQLVQYMTKHGLQFAPAVKGDEAAYTALHRALASYDTAAKAVPAKGK